MNEAMLDETNQLLRLLIVVMLRNMKHYSLTPEEVTTFLQQLDQIPHYRSNAI